MNGLVEARRAPTVVEDLPVSWGTGFQAATEQSFMENPGVKLALVAKNAALAASDELNEVPKLTREQVQEKAKLAGVEITAPEDGYYPSQLDSLIERRQEERFRRRQIEQSGLGSAGQFAAGLVGSLPDPLNIAAAFIPFGGEAYWAAKLARPGISTLGKVGVRAAQGAVQGAAGAAVLEPVSYATGKALQDDYTIANSFMNVVFGAGVGSLAHASFGALGDLRATHSTEKLSPTVQAELRNTAIVQSIEERAIDVTPILKRERVSAERRQSVARALDPEAFIKFDELKARELDLKSTRSTLEAQLGSSKVEDLELSLLVSELNSELKNPDLAPELRERVQAGKTELIEQYGVQKIESLPEPPSQASLLEYTNTIKELGSVSEKKAGFELRLSGAYEKADRRIRKGKVKADQVVESTGDGGEISGPSTSFKPLPPEVPDPGDHITSPESLKPQSALMQPELEKAHAQELLELPVEHRTQEEMLADLKAETNEILQNAREQSKLAGMEDEAFEEAFEGAKEVEKASKEYGQVLDEMASCLLGSGDENG